MSYEKVSDITAKPKETVVRLETGDLVAVSCDREHSGGTMRFFANARAINEDGETIANAIGGQLKASLSYAVDMQVVESEGAEIIARDCLLAVIGEPVDRQGWSAQWLSSASIRSHLVAAQSVGSVNAGDLL